MALQDLAEQIMAGGGKLEERADGTPVITIPVGSKRRMAREPEADAPLPLGDTRSSRGADDRLRLYIERVERLAEEAKGIADDIKDVFSEVKSAGYDVKAVREVVRLRKMDADARRQFQGVLDTYLCALGLA